MRAELNVCRVLARKRPHSGRPDALMDFYVAAIIVIVALVAVRMLLRRQRNGLYREIFQTTSRNGSLPEAMVKRLRDEGIRYRIVYKGPPNQPFIGMSGEQFVSIEVHIADIEKAKRVVSRILNDAWRGRS